MRYWRLLVITALFAVSLVSVGARQPNAATPLLRLHRGTFDIQRVSPAVAAPLDTSIPDLLIVQFRNPITPADRERLSATGVTILEYLPDFAYLVRGSARELAAAGTLPGLYGTEPFLLADKLSPALLATFSSRQPAYEGLEAIAWPGREADLAQELASRNLRLAEPQPASAISTLAALDSVRSLDYARAPFVLNGNGRNIMRVNPPAYRHNLFGAGQIVAVTDSGLDTGDFSTLSPDFADRIIATHVLSAGQNWDDNNGHGTHVAGSVASSGIQSGALPATHVYTNSFAGIAPEADLVIQAFEAAANGSITGLGSDLYPVLNQVYQSGARIHTNSWGDYTGPVTSTAAKFGGYPYWSQRVDQFLWEHQDMTALFAAGNSGADGVPGALGFCTGGNGIIDPDSLVTPATSKNGIAVGASENTTTTGLGGVPWLLLSFCFATQPISTDTMASNPNGMAAFSSRGPTDDGRMKPDIVAPGSNVISNRSFAPGASTLGGAHESNFNYVYSPGTSMAAPQVAGMTALIREWVGRSGMTNPSAAMLKAILLNTTASMAPGQYDPTLYQEIPYTTPNSVNGWGRADLHWVAQNAPSGLWFADHTTGLTTNQEVVYTSNATQSLQVYTSTQPLRVMIAWTDPPASLSAAQQLVNDLDLTVIGPGGQVYYGNNTFHDRLNNVEGVIIPNPPIGQYTVRVKAFNVPVSTQPFGLSVYGPIREPGTDPVPTATPTPPPATATPAPSTATPTSTAVPATATPTTAPNTATPTTAPNTATPTTAPNTATPTTAPNTATPTSTAVPATATPTTAPNTATPTTAPSTATPTSTTVPATATPTTAPSTATPTSTPGTNDPYPFDFFIPQLVRQTQ